MVHGWPTLFRVWAFFRVFCHDNIFVLNSLWFAESMGEKKIQKSSKKVLTFGLKVV